MSRAVLLCLVLFVGTVSAWGGWDTWHGWGRKNVNTECGKFTTLRQGWWFIDNSKTDVDTRRILQDFKDIDADKDGFVTFAEAYAEAAFMAADPPMSIDNGFSRCTHTMFEVKRYGFDKEVSSNIFDLLDANSDLVVDRTDLNPTTYLQQDENGDGRVSVCEAFRGFMKAIQYAENKKYLRDLQYENLVWKHRRPTIWNSWNVWKW